MDEIDFTPLADEQKIQSEKARAKTLRQSPWWKKKCATGICYYCRNKIKPNELTMDHLIPLIRGGLSIKSNLVPCCKECNNKKKYMLPMEWQEYMNSLQRTPEEGVR